MDPSSDGPPPTDSVGVTPGTAVHPNGLLFLQTLLHRVRGDRNGPWARMCMTQHILLRACRPVPWPGHAQGGLPEGRAPSCILQNKWAHLMDSSTEKPSVAFSAALSTSHDGRLDCSDSGFRRMWQKATRPQGLSWSRFRATTAHCLWVNY